MNFYIDPGGPGGHPGGSRTHSGAAKFKKRYFLIFEFFLNWNRYELEPVGTEPTRTEPGAPCIDRGPSSIPKTISPIATRLA